MNDAAGNEPIPAAANDPAATNASVVARLKRRPWRALLGAALLLAALATLVAHFGKAPTFVASALIMIEDSAPYIAFSDGGSTASSTRYVKTQIELLRSPLVLEVLLSIPEIATFPDVVASEDRLSHLQERLSITRINDSELYNVSYESPSPQHSALVANAVVDQYLTLQERSDFERYQRVIELLENERKNRSVVVEQLRRKVMDLAQPATGMALFGEDVILDAQALNKPVAAVLTQLREVEIAIEVLMAEIAYQREQPGSAADESLPAETDPAVDRPPFLAAWGEAIDALQAELAAIKEADGQWSGSPHFAKLAEQVAAQQTSLDELIKAAPTSPPRESPAPSAGDIRSLAVLEQELRALAVKRDLLAKQLEEKEHERRAANSKLMQLTFARDELEREEAVFEIIAGRKLAMQTESRAPTRVNVRQKAAVPALPHIARPYERPAVLASAAILAVAGVALLATSRSQPESP